MLYLRSFLDDGVDVKAHQTDDIFSRLVLSLFRRRYGDVRLEQVLALTAGRRGPFVAIANPNDIMPEVGAFRAHHSNETWQTAIVEWVRAAQLIVQVAGPTSWLRWELETILAASAGPKLILIFPSGPPMSS